MAKKTAKDFKIISLWKLATASNMNYQKLYNNMIGKYNSITEAEKTALCNVLYEELEPMSEFLEVKIILKRNPK